MTSSEHLTGLQLGYVTLQVRSLARSLEFYERVLGLHTLSRGDDTAQLGTSANEPLVELRENPRITAPARRLLGLYHFAVLLPDRASLGRFIKHLAAIGERAGSADHLVSEALYLQDPDNLGIEVYADRPRDLWRMNGGQIAMASDPLDFANLVDAAGQAPWTGMPPGTRIGHVHLHVGDIDRASAFYHEALGLGRMVWSYPGALFLAADGYHHHLGVNTWAGAGARSAGDDDAKLLEWRIHLPSQVEVDRAVQRMTSSGLGPVRDGGGYLLRDPWGTFVRLVHMP